MPPRATATEQYQLGIESTAGTGVAANLRPLALTSLNLRGQEPKTRYRAGGSETPNAESQEKCWSEFDGEGPICYNLLPYVLSSLLVADASSPYEFVPNAFGVDTIKTLTIEKGAGSNGEKAAYCFVKTARLRFTKKDTSLTFSGEGRKLQSGITMTASPTKVASVPVDPKKVDLYIGEDEAGLAVVKWQEIEVNIGERWAAHFEGNSANDSFEEHTKVANEHTIQATITTPATIADLITAARNKETRCVRIKAESALEYSAGNNYDLEITANCFVEMPDTSGETDNVVSAQVNFIMTYDAGFNTTGGFLKVTVANA